MFDLQTGIHFEKVEGVLPGIVDKLHRPGATIVHQLAELYGGIEQRRTGGGRQIRRGRLFNNLLVAPLQRTVALAKRHHVAVTVTKNLHLDMTRTVNAAFNKHARVAEELFAQTAHALPALRQRLGVGAARQANTAAARGTF